MNIDPHLASLLLALSTVKRQIMQELDRFMTICWDRVGITSPEQQYQQQQQQQQNGSGTGANGSGRGPNSMANIFTPGKCVPVLVFVIERVPVSVPWYGADASENQISEILKQQVLKKSVDALQTRLRYVFRACRLVQSIDPPAGAFDARQLFVLPSPSSTPFVHVIPYFTAKLDLPLRGLVPPTNISTRSGEGNILDPAEEVLKQQRMKTSAPHSATLNKKNSLRTKGEDPTEEPGSQSSLSNTAAAASFGMPTLRELYDAAVHTRDQPLVRRETGKAGSINNGEEGSLSSSSSSVSLGSLYLNHTGPLLRQFVEGWVKSVTSPGGYGNVVGKRNSGTVEVPSLQQWMAGCLGVCEALGVTSLSSPTLHKEQELKTTVGSGVESGATDQEQVSAGEHLRGNRSSKANASLGGGGAGGGRRLGSSKKYSQRCANMVQKKIQDYVLTDDVMEELYGQKPDVPGTTTRAHSERYHQLKANQATKLFQSLAHRR
ncbi:hypothetical protein BC939DRAFT_184065 [Gamsiella multidivaricata]|uniref:uncharacterized protein n=1 Tax=Gamsiella multidivaricata TaxID=101098 RepID=UPI00221F204E|nr:uncharacterized protein BC939DRAFT_184065 [Gamsiella multidivaricata]KAI7831362.1 hypothetical protein BC939DRAFT_184065 [Gamsiella multidivaricata]